MEPTPCPTDIAAASEEAQRITSTASSDVLTELLAAKVQPSRAATPAAASSDVVVAHLSDVTYEWMENVVAMSGDEELVLGAEDNDEPTSGAGRGVTENCATPSGKAVDTSRRGRRGTAVGERKRHRKATGEVSELDKAFKNSQRLLRRQASSISIRDAVSRSLTIQSTDEQALVGSPVFASPTMSPSSPCCSTTWSPCLVGELTNQFLANVKQQKRQRFEQLVSRELTQSQLHSQTQPGSDKEESRGHGLANTKAFATGSSIAAPMDDLIIGEEENENANWMPFSAKGEIRQREDSNGDDGHLSSGRSMFERGPSSRSFKDSVDDRNDLAEANSQQQVLQSLTRKHEIWKLRQRHLKAQQQMEFDARTTQPVQPKGSLTAAFHADGNVLGSSYGIEASFDPLQHRSALSSYPAAPSSTSLRSLSKMSLSSDDISMIRRINNFDNTSTQRVVVFGTSSKMAQDEKKN